MPVLFVEENGLVDKKRVFRIAFVTEGMSDEDLASGIRVDSVPEPESNGMLYQLYINPQNKEMWYEYEEVPKSEMEILKEENEALKKSQADQDELLMQLMLSMGGN
ncbi:hypothetical protein [Lysinibacillus sp. F5]|uniref:hypothetical protein n=1 Tax=Lysinibacillus sp. F5 TaxID=1700846 RepID=UPI000738B05F|nr:hypothetical protein [Lysinibacillus sp. F5]KUF29991.1 hypothetical protein AK833_18185 [Lysinibacillus sp. F5]